MALEKGRKLEITYEEISERPEKIIIRASKEREAMDSWSGYWNMAFEIIMNGVGCGTSRTRIALTESVLSLRNFPRKIRELT